MSGSRIQPGKINFPDYEKTLRPLRMAVRDLEFRNIRTSGMTVQQIVDTAREILDTPIDLSPLESLVCSSQSFGTV